MNCWRLIYRNRLMDFRVCGVDVGFLYGVLRLFIYLFLWLVFISVCKS